MVDIRLPAPWYSQQAGAPSMIATSGLPTTNSVTRD